jgi:hypothetical protein
MKGRRNPVARAVRRLKPQTVQSRRQDIPRKTKHKAAERRPCEFGRQAF